MKEDIYTLRSLGPGGMSCHVMSHRGHLEREQGGQEVRRWRDQGGKVDCSVIPQNDLCLLQSLKDFSNHLALEIVCERQ